MFSFSDSTFLYLLHCLKFYILTKYLEYKRIATFIEEPTVTMKCRTVITVLFLYFNVGLNILLVSLSYLFTFKYFLTNYI